MKPANLNITPINRILEARLKECFETHGDKIPIKYRGYIMRAMMDLLAEYDEFLLHHGYVDADVRCEEPTAIDSFLYNK